MYMALALGAQIHQPTACSRLTHFSCTVFTRSHMLDCVFTFFLQSSQPTSLVSLVANSICIAICIACPNADLK